MAIKKEGLERVYREIELPLMPIIEKMQARGVKIDTGYLRELSEKYHRELAKLEKKIYEQAGATFNINSPRQLGKFIVLGVSGLVVAPLLLLPEHGKIDTECQGETVDHSRAQQLQ